MQLQIDDFLSKPFYTRQRLVNVGCCLAQRYARDELSEAYENRQPSYTNIDRLLNLISDYKRATSALWIFDAMLAQQMVERTDAWLAELGTAERPSELSEAHLVKLRRRIKRMEQLSDSLQAYGHASHRRYVPEEVD